MVINYLPHVRDEYMTFYDELVSINRAEDSQTLQQLHTHSTKSRGCQFSSADSSISVITKSAKQIRQENTGTEHV